VSVHCNVYFVCLCSLGGCTVTTISGEITSDDLSITVNFTSDIPNALFECKLNNREFVSCELLIIVTVYC